MCITCSGMHRGLGRHVSRVHTCGFRGFHFSTPKLKVIFLELKVRSLALDHWDAESEKIMLALGNDKANAIYEMKLKEDQSLLSEKPTPESDRWVFSPFVLRGPWGRIKHLC